MTYNVSNGMWSLTIPKSVMGLT